jgi:lysozyme family protein
MACFEIALAHTLQIEGGYTVDTGGPTNLGVTQSLLDEWCTAFHHPPMDVRYLDRATAKQVYLDMFWRPLNCDQIPDHEVAAELFDSAVNCGLQTGARFLQKALNCVLAHNRGYTFLAEDGAIGPATLEAIRTALREGHKKNLVKCQNIAQGFYYIGLAMGNRDKYAKYFNGWLVRIWEDWKKLEEA